jgi:ADP-ribose pyrophosphatase YjhB (NUDIX family)
VNVAVMNDAGQLLLIRRTDNGNWALPGGAMDIGESISEAAVRETLEETGVTCRVVGLIGIYTNPRHVLEYTSNGEVRQEFSVVFRATFAAGEPTPSSESSSVVWADPDRLDDYSMHPSMRQRVEHALRLDAPYIG